jgi:hypothetical protein
VFLSPRFGRESVGFQSCLIVSAIALPINAFRLLIRPDVMFSHARILGIGPLLYTA